MLALILSGCAPTIYDKPSGSQAQFNADKYLCEKDMRQSGPFGPGLIGIYNSNKFFDRCMIARGYTIRE